MSDGVYTLGISNVSHVNHTAANSTMPLELLADGSLANTEARNGEIRTVAGPAGGDGNGALLLQTDNGNGRLRFNDAYSPEQYLNLGELDDLSFKYYVDTSDRTDVIPVIRLTIDADGDVATTNDRGELVFEYAYQGFGPVVQDQWQTADLAGGDWVAWQRSFGVNRDQIANMTELSDWADADGYTPAGGLHFDQNSLILGWSIALGSGNGTNTTYIDDLQVGGVTYDFMV
jgi:hypothetical protein